MEKCRSEKRAIPEMKKPLKTGVSRGKKNIKNSEKRAIGYFWVS